MTKQKFVTDRTGTLRFWPPEEGVATSATVTLYRPDGSELQASASATIASTSTTVGTGGAAKGARSFPVTSATGMKKGDRLLVQEAGRKWCPYIQDIASTTVYPDARVPFALTASTATVKEYDLSKALTTTHTDVVDDNYYAKWIYTVDSVTYEHIQLFDVVGAVDYFPTTISDVVRRHPWLEAHRKDHDLDMEKALETAWKQILIPLLQSRSMRIEKARDLQAVVPLHVACVQMLFAEDLAMSSSDWADQAEAARAHVDRVLQYLVSDVGWYDEDQDLAADTGEEHQVRTNLDIVQ